MILSNTLQLTYLRCSERQKENPDVIAYFHYLLMYADRSLWRTETNGITKVYPLVFDVFTYISRVAFDIECGIWVRNTVLTSR